MDQKLYLLTFSTLKDSPLKCKALLYIFFVSLEVIKFEIKWKMSLLLMLYYYY